MGADPLGIVDARLKLKGTENVWIGDASVMPQIVSGNTNAPTIMIGERVADFILREARWAGVETFSKNRRWRIDAPMELFQLAERLL